MLNRNLTDDQQTQETATAAMTVLNPADQVPAGQQFAQQFGEKEMTGDIFDLLNENATTTYMSGELTEELKTFSENIEKISVIDPTIKVEIINDPQLLCLPVVVFANKVNGVLNAHVAMIEAGMTSPLENKKYNVQGTLVELQTSTGSLVDAHLRTVVANHLVRKNIGNVQNITAVNIPASSDLTSPSVARVILSAAKLAISGGQMPFVAKNLAAKGAKVVTNFTLTPGSTGVDAVGRPVAQDLVARTTLRKVTPNRHNQQQGQDRSQHNQGAEFVISEAKATLDFMRDESIAGQRMNNMQYGRVQAAPAYVPVLVGTEVSGIGNYTKSCEGVVSQMLGLFSLNAMGQDQNWKRLFLRNAAHGTQMADLGVLGLDYDPFGEATWSPKREVISTHGQQATEGAIPLEFMLQNYILPSTVIALDVEDGGVASWIQNDLVAAAYNDAAAHQRVVAELDKFFNGGFTKHFKGNSLFCAQPSTIHLGGYADAKTHAQRDVRSVGYLDALDATDGAQDIMGGFSIIPGNSLPVTLDTRKKILDEISGFTQTGWATRLYFAPAVFAAMNAAIAESGFGIELENLEPLTNFAGRATGLFTTNMLDQVDTGSAFYHGHGDQNAAGSNQYSMFRNY